MENIGIKLIYLQSALQDAISYTSVLRDVSVTAPR
jgi:hypothetical protein